MRFFKIKIEELKAHLPNTISNLSVLKPKLILTLQQEVQDGILEYLKKQKAEILSKEIKEVKSNTSKYEFCKPSICKVQWKDTRFIIAKSPQHSSKFTLMNEGAADEYLKYLMKQSINI